MLAGHPDGRPVALKMMKHRHQWESEIRSRQKHLLFSSTALVDLLAWHVAKGENTIPNKRRARSEPAPSDTAYKYLLVMDRGDSSVFQGLGD